MAKAIQVGDIVVKWYASLPWWVQALAAIAGGTVRQWADGFAEPYRTAFNWISVAVVAASVVALLAHALKALRGEKAVTPFVLIAVGLIGLVGSIALLVIGILWQGGFAAPVSVIQQPDYSYTLAYQGVGLGYDPSNETAALQISVNLANVSRAPIRYTVTAMRVVIDDKTLANPNFTNSGGIVPSSTGRTYRYPAFSLKTIGDYVGKRAEGAVEFTVEYGSPNLPPVRRLTLVLNITLNLGSVPGGIADIIGSENEVPIKAGG